MPEENIEIVEPADTNYHKLKELILAWYPYQSGWFSSDDVDRQFNVKTRSGKQNRWTILERLVKSGQLTKNKNNNRYRSVLKDVVELDWLSADTGNDIELSFPFELERYVKIYPKSVIIVAGASNAGKTSFMYNFVLNNMYHPLGVDLYNTDAGVEEVKERFSNFEVDIPYPPPFRTYEYFGHFADVINPNRINVIDYLEMDGEVYEVGHEIKAIWQALDKGIAVIAIQKKKNTGNFQTELGYGGDFTLFKSRLYLSIDRSTAMPGYSVLKIVKAKSWKDSHINPNGKEWAFKLVNGCDFVNVMEVTKEN